MGRFNLITKCFSILLIVIIIGLIIYPSIENITKKESSIDDTYSSDIRSFQDALEPLGWWDTDWLYSERITINHLKVDESLTNFPVLLSVTSDDLKNAQPDGDDFVFTSQGNTTKYNHEIELYNQSNGELIAWVNIPGISANVDTIFYIYYGNSGCSNQENIAGTWDSNYIGVFHMNQVNGSLFDSAGIQDATNYENDTQYQQIGKVGYCVELGGYRDGGYFLVEGNNDAYKFHNDDVTLEAWVNLDQNKFSDDTIIFLGRSTTTWPSWPQMTLRKLKNIEENGKFMMQCGETNESKTRALSNDNGDNVLGRWIHSVGVVSYSGDELLIFMDGIEQTITDTVGDYDLSALPSYQFKVAIGYDGMGEEPNYNYLDGKIDEVRISNIARSPAWISTSYNNMYEPETFMLFGEGFTITSTISGSGTIIKNPDQTTYFPYTTVELTADASMGWTFNHWSGHIPPGYEYDNPVIITMDENKAVTAYFDATIYNLDVIEVGNGTVILDPAGGGYIYNSIVELNAIGDPGWMFDHWDENLSGSENPAYITITENISVVANFSQEEYNLTIVYERNGTVEKNPNQTTYRYGDIVELNAIGDPGWVFDHWDGNLSGDANPGNITIDGDKVVIANFSLYIDTVPPEIINITAKPSSAYPGGYVNITCEVIDNIAVDEVWVNITYPNGTSANLSMDSENCYNNQTYSMNGTYNFFIWANDTNAISNKSIIYRFGIGTDFIETDFHLNLGWNILTIPIINNYNAITLSENINGSELISWFDSSIQMYKSYIVGGPPSFSFQIKDGYGYFILLNNNSNFSISGIPIATVSIPLYVGWNLIGWHQIYNTTASSLADNISGCELISWFDSGIQMYKSYIVGGPPSFDFIITSGMGIFVLVNIESVWSSE